MAVLWTFREPSLCRHVRREFMRNAWLDFTTIIPATACHQRNYVETYSRSILRSITPMLPIRIGGRMRANPWYEPRRSVKRVVNNAMVGPG